MAREGQGYPCYQRDMMMMMIPSEFFILAFASGLSLESESLQVSLGLLDYFEYSR